MSLRLVAFGFASALLLITGAPAFADDAVIMDNSQENITTGNNNNSVNQNLQDSSIDSRRGNTGTSMRSRQVNDTVGDDNTSINVNGQKSRRIRR
jgi:hypothetical protein